MTDPTVRLLTYGSDNALTGVSEAALSDAVMTASEYLTDQIMLGNTASVTVLVSDSYCSGTDDHVHLPRAEGVLAGAVQYLCTACSDRAVAEVPDAGLTWYDRNATLTPPAP